MIRTTLTIIAIFFLHAMHSLADNLPEEPLNGPTCSDFHANEACLNLTTQIQNGLWYNENIWPNATLPMISDVVVIPSGMEIIMVRTMRANTIEVSGTLKGVNWQTESAWIELQTKAIHVLNGGRFEMVLHPCLMNRIA